jgi:alpha-galactosidase
MIKISLRIYLIALVTFWGTGVCLAQESELAKTPPMGWNSWNCFHLDISDAMIRAQAAAMVKSGMKDAGYQYIVIDGGWEGYHDTNGVFHPDAKRFPDMKALCDYVHSLGLKIGIHTSPGPTTCAGHEASYGHEKQDAETFARWGIDFVKYDWCSGDQVYKPDQMQQAYQKMSDDLKATGRPILFSLCQYGMQNVWEWGASAGGQMWRTTGDIADNYSSMILHGLEENGLEKYAGPGHWNDPDMLEVGNGGMNTEEYRTHMSLWAILAAPLLAGNDLSKMTPETVELLTNKDVVAVDQDPAGKQGDRVWSEGPIEVWSRTLADGSKAVGVFNRHPSALPAEVDFRKLGFAGPVKAKDLWGMKDMGTISGPMAVKIPGHGVLFLRVRQ